MFTRRLCLCTTNCRRFHDFRPYNEDLRWPDWQVIIGIETHAQIRSRRKLFSGTLAHSNSYLIDICPQIPRRQRLMLLQIFTYHPLTLLFLEHFPCVLQYGFLQPGIFTRQNLENQPKMCRPCNTHCTGIEMSDTFSVIF